MAKSKSPYINDLLEDGAKIPANDDITLPEWFDAKKFKRAQQFFKDNFFAVLLGKLLGLLTMVAIPSMIKILNHTQHGENAFKAYRRYIKTIMHVITWYQNDLTPESSAWKSLAAVRKIHASASTSSNKHNLGIINQKDMAITQYGLMGFVITKYNFLGIKYDQEEMEAFVHFWRVIGYMIGMQDKYNVCTDSMETTIARCDQICDQIVRPALQVENADFSIMTHNLINGLWSYIPILNHEAFIYFLKRMVGVPEYTYWKSENPSGQKNKLGDLNTVSRTILFVVIMLLEKMMCCSFVRSSVNTLLQMSTFFITYFPMLAFFQFGFKSTYVSIRY